MNENKKDVEKNTGMLTSFIFWLVGIFSIFGSLFFAFLFFNSNEYRDIHELMNLSLFEIGLVSLIIAISFIKRSFLLKTSTEFKHLYYVIFKYLYYIGITIGITGFTATILMQLRILLLTLLSLKLLNPNLIFMDYVYISIFIGIIIVVIATFILFQISFIRIHRLFLSKKQSNLKTNN